MVVAHGLVLKLAMGLLAEDGAIGLADIGPDGGRLAGGPPHLDNGRWITFEMAKIASGEPGGCP